MKKFCAVVLGLLVLAAACRGAGGGLRPFEKGDRWGAAGDSITHGGGWLEFLLIYNLCAHPEKSFELLNLGSGGDAIHLALKRLDWDIVDRKPTVVTLMFGVNDVWHEHSGATKKGDYMRAMREATGRLQAAGIEVWLVAPPPYDDKTEGGNPLDPKRGGLSDYVAQLRDFAREKNIPLIDFYGEMEAILTERHKTDPRFTLFGKDRVHLRPSGNFMMADIFLRATGAIAADKLLSLEARDDGLKCAEANGAEFEFLGREGDAWRFEVSGNSLPFPRSIVPPQVLQLEPAMAKSNRHVLKITGLKKGNYLLKIDGVEMGSFTTRNFADGVDVGIVTKSPQVRQAEELAALVRKWNGIFRKKLRYSVMMEYGELATHLADDDVGSARQLVAAKLERIKDAETRARQEKRFAEYLEYKARQTEIAREAEALYAEILEKAKPRRHVFEIVKSGRGATADVADSGNVTYVNFPSRFLGEDAHLAVLDPSVPGKKRGPKAVLFVLPTSTKAEGGTKVLSVLESTGLHKKYNLLCVMPRFDKTPWFANHADDPKIQHERHILEELVPFVEKTWFSGKRVPRYLVGFSKSGWGALSLILRNPDFFEKAAAWDAPVLLRDEDFGIWGMGENMGTLKVFHEFHPMLLCAKNAADFQKGVPRIFFGGADIFGEQAGEKYRNPGHTEGFRGLMKKHGVKHVYFPDLNVRHGWDPYWIVPMLGAMLGE